MANIYSHILSIVTLSGIISLSLNYLMINLAKSKGWVSKVDFRRKKKRRVPLLGGVPLFMGVLGSVYIFKIESSIPLILSALPLIIIGALDDVLELRARWKLLGQLISTLTWLTLINGNDLILNQVGIPNEIGYLISGFWIIAIINSINLIDSMDSEAVSISLVGFIFFMILMGAQANSFEFLVALVGSCLGFMFFNWPPARIYLGDSGATFLGFVLATTGLSLKLPGSSSFYLLTPLFILALPQMDSLLSILRRVYRSTSIAKGDQDHVHHKLMKIGMSVIQALSVLVYVSIFTGFSGLLVWNAQPDFLGWGIVAVSIVSQLSLLFSIFYIENRHAHQVSSYSRTLIAQSLKLSDEVTVELNDFRSVIYDLFPYYKDLQQRGIVSVQVFIQDFSEFIKKHHPQSQLKMLGAYSIVVCESPKSDSLFTKHAIIKEFFKLLDNHNVRKNDSDIPWGLSFFSENENGRQFLSKLNIQFSNEKDMNKFKKTG